MIHIVKAVAADINKNLNLFIRGVIRKKGESGLVAF
jgi:hypothetical protein